jgi:molecular chaperone DnaJ
MKDSGFTLSVTDTAHLGVTSDECSGHRTDLTISKRMTWNAGGLFDDHPSLTFDDHIDVESRIRSRVKVGRTWESFEGHAIPNCDQSTLLGSPPIQPDFSRGEKRLHSTSAQTRGPASQHDIEPLTGIFRFDLELECWHLLPLPHSARAFHAVCAVPRRVYTAKPVGKRDYYVILEVSRAASGDEIKRAYRALAMRYHPDRNPDDPAAEDAFKEASEAYAVLSDPDKRNRYDRYGHDAFNTNGPGFEASDFGAVSEILEGLFGEVFSGGRRKRRGGRDLKYELEISFVEAALGIEKTIDVNRPAPCVTCGGSGAQAGTPVHKCNVCQGRGQVKYQRGLFAASRPCHGCRGTGTKIPTPCEACKGTGTKLRAEAMSVKIPAGVQDGAVRTVRGAGETVDGANGDLHIHVHVRDHALFTREEADILVSIPISFPQAVLGASIDVPTLDGNVVMKVPPGTQSGKVFRLRGKGISVYGGYGKGDQLVTVVVEVPRQVSRRQRKLIAELAEEIGDESHPEQASFLRKLRGLFES